MADNPNKGSYGRQYKGKTSPGVSGAIRDLIDSLSRAAAPKSITHADVRRKMQLKESGVDEISVDDLKAYVKTRKKSIG